MSKQAIKYVRYVAAAILFMALMINIYYVSPGQNNFAEPWDLIYSVVTPLLLMALVILLVPPSQRLQPKKYNSFSFYIAIAAGLVMYGGSYLSRNYWSTMNSFWSFILSVLVPAVLFLCIIIFMLRLDNNKNKN